MSIIVPAKTIHPYQPVRSALRTERGALDAPAAMLLAI